MNSLLAVATLNNADASTKPLPIPEQQQPLLPIIAGRVLSLVEPVVPRRPATHGVICGLVGEGGYYSKYRRNSADCRLSQHDLISQKESSSVHTTLSWRNRRGPKHEPGL